MVYSREHAIRDILAFLAREGYRLPPGTAVSLLKLWKLMDLPTTAHRRELLAERPEDFGGAGPAPGPAEPAATASNSISQAKQGFTDLDLLRIKCSFTKLVLLFNEPSRDPEECELLELMMGQKGLEPLRQMLFGERYRAPDELYLLKMRYDAGCTWFPRLPLPLDELIGKNYTLPGMPAEEMGKTHMEHWGAHYDRTDMSTMKHLLRPTFLVAEELVRRGLDLEDQAMQRLLWGDDDPQSSLSLNPSLSEMYMEDADYKLRLLDTSHHFQQVEVIEEPPARASGDGSRSSEMPVDLETPANEGLEEDGRPRRPNFQYPKSPARLSTWKEANPFPAQSRARTVNEVKRDSVCINSAIFDPDSPMYLGHADPDAAAAALARVPTTLYYQDEWEDSERQDWLRLLGDDSDGHCSYSLLDDLDGCIADESTSS